MNELTYTLFRVFIFLELVTLSYSIFCCVTTDKIIERGEKNKNFSYIPVYNLIVLLDVVKLSRIMAILLFIPVTNILVLMLISYRLSIMYNLGKGFTIGLILLPIIFLPILNYIKIPKVENVNEFEDATDEMVTLLSESEMKKLNEVEPEIEVDNVFKREEPKFVENVPTFKAGNTYMQNNPLYNSRYNDMYIKPEEPVENITPTSLEETEVNEEVSNEFEENNENVYEEQNTYEPETEVEETSAQENNDIEPEINANQDVSFGPSMYDEPTPEENTKEEPLMTSEEPAVDLFKEEATTESPVLNDEPAIEMPTVITEVSNEEPAITLGEIPTNASYEEPVIGITEETQEPKVEEPIINEPMSPVVENVSVMEEPVRKAPTFISSQIANDVQKEVGIEMVTEQPKIEVQSEFAETQNINTEEKKNMFVNIDGLENNSSESEDKDFEILNF